MWREWVKRHSGHTAFSHRGCRLFVCSVPRRSGVQSSSDDTQWTIADPPSTANRPDFPAARQTADARNADGRVVQHLVSGGTNLRQTSVIEFPYDASTLGSDATDSKNLCVSYLDEVRNEWVRVEATVVKTRQKIAVTTDHMSNVLEEIIKANASCLALLPYTSPSVGSVFRSGEMHDSGLSTNGGSP